MTAFEAAGGILAVSPGLMKTIHHADEMNKVIFTIPYPTQRPVASCECAQSRYNPRFMRVETQPPGHSPGSERLLLPSFASSDTAAVRHRYPGDEAGKGPGRSRST